MAEGDLPLNLGGSNEAGLLLPAYELNAPRGLESAGNGAGFSALRVLAARNASGTTGGV